MSRPLRTIVILLGMGLIAIAALSVLAGRLRTRDAASPGRATATREVVPPMPDPAPGK